MHFQARPTCVSRRPSGVLQVAILAALLPLSGTGAREAVILSDGDFDSLPVGTAPNNRDPAGAWAFPSSYIAGGFAEGPRSQFEIVDTADFDPAGQGNSLRLLSSANGDFHLPNIFDIVLREAPDLIVRAKFDIYIPDGPRSGGTFYLGADQGGGGANRNSDRGPQFGWERGRLVYCGPSCDDPSQATTLLREYPHDQWQTVQLDMNLHTDTFDFSWAAGDDPLELIGSDLPFRRDLRALDRFTFVHFSVIGSVESYLDNVSITLPGTSLNDSSPLRGAGDSYFETFDETLGADGEITGQFLPSGWSAFDIGEGRGVQINRSFPIASSLRRGSAIFNAGEAGDADRALALGVTRSTEQGTLQFLADIVDSGASSFQLEFDVEAWDAARVQSLGEAAFDVTVELSEGDEFVPLADLGRVTTGPTLFPPAAEWLDGNADVNRVQFDSGVIDADIPEGSQLRVRWTAAADAETQNWIFGLDNVRLSLFGDETAAQLLAGDADQDLKFDQLDLVRVQAAAKYLTGQEASWGEGDWNGAPGGAPGEPPAGDGVFDQLDIIAAQQAGVYLSGPYASVSPNGQRQDAQTSVVYDSNTGEVSVDAPAGSELTSINIDSASGIFTGEAAQSLGGSFDNDADGNIFKATFGGSFGSVSFGRVAQTGLSEEFLLNDLTVVGSQLGGGDLGAVDLIYVPEPTTVALLIFGSCAALCRFVRRIS